MTRRDNKIIPIEQATAESVSKSVFESEFGWLKRELGGVNKIMVGVIVVLVIGFITLLLMIAQMLIDSWRWKSGNDQLLLQSIQNSQTIIKTDTETQNRQNEILKSINDSLNQIKAQKK